MIQEQTADVKSASLLDVIKNRNFTKLWMAQILSQTAQQIVNFALVLQVNSITHSSTAVSGVIIAFTVPAILFAAIAGVFVERNSKKTMLVLTNVLRGVMVLAYVFTDSKWGVGAVLPIFYIVTLLFSSVSQFFNPAEASMIPLLVKREELVAANSLFNLTLPATQLGGFVILGPLLLKTVFHNTNFNGLYVVIFVLCIAAAGLTYLLPQDDRDSTLAGQREKGEKVKVAAVAAGAGQIARSGYRVALDELAEGWHFIRRDHVIMSAILYWSVAIAVFMMLGTIGPGFLENVLQIDPNQLIYILMPGGVGLVIGVLIVGRVSTPRNRDTTINWSLLAAAITLIVFALIYPVLHYLYNTFAHRDPSEMVILSFLGLLTLILGISNSFISVPAQTALQERSPEDIRARVFSAFYTVSNAILLVPVFFAGALADWIGYVPTVTAIGLIVLLIAGAGLLRRRKNGPPTVPLSGVARAQEVEAALATAAPGQRPIPAATQQEALGTKGELGEPAAQ
ncbi:MAG: MFS transporter [Chloroflexota bacterium]|nr:MFS transporter [Chloroflexota bacterium]